MYYSNFASVVINSDLGVSIQIYREGGAQTLYKISLKSYIIPLKVLLGNNVFNFGLAVVHPLYLLLNFKFTFPQVGECYKIAKYQALYPVTLEYFSIIIANPRRG